MAPADYPAHYRLITERLRAIYPQLVIVASARWRDTDDEDGSPCLSGQRCDVWDKHYYQTADEMAAMGGLFDTYDRMRPPIFVGEYAANKPDGVSTLRAAIAESIFMLGFERNADVIQSSAFAPLLANVHGTQWPYSLINFDASRVYCLPSYHILRMLTDARGTRTLKTELQGDGMPGANSGSSSSRWSASATVGETGERLWLKLANYGEGHRLFNISLVPWAPRTAATATATILSAPTSDASNTLEEPAAVAPTVAPAPKRVPTGLLVDLPPYSFVVVDVKMA